jgi:hypothetical protein
VFRFLSFSAEAQFIDTTLNLSISIPARRGKRVSILEVLKSTLVLRVRATLRDFDVEIYDLNRY